MTRSTNNSSLAETDSAVIRSELDRLLCDRRFSGARQMSNFLRYIVNETLKGNGSRIKAYTVGVDALGKSDDFDAQADPSVRVLALRLRKTLSAAYEDEAPCFARIVLRVGSYVPEFYKPEAFVEPDPRRKPEQVSHEPSKDMTSVGESASPDTSTGASVAKPLGTPGADRQISADSPSSDAVGCDWTPGFRISRNTVARTMNAGDASRPLLPLVLLSSLLLIWQVLSADVRADAEVDATPRMHESAAGQIILIDTIEDDVFHATSTTD